MKPTNSERLRPGFSSTGMALMLACLSLAGICWMHASSLDTKARADQAVAVNDKVSEEVSRPIEQIRVGQRVITPQSTATDALSTAVDPASWKEVSLRMVAAKNGQVIDTMLVETVQPPQWLGEHQVKVGARVPIPLDLKEMGVPEQLAEVTAVSACPPIETGPGRVVLTTVNHLNNFLFDLSVRGERAPPSVITVTGWHKLYSEDRGAWVSVCELKTGEKMRGRDGPLSVASLVRHPGVETVYNMTVEGEHQYYVADARLLAHNMGCRSADLQPGQYRRPGPPLTTEEGIQEAANGGDVMTDSQGEAYGVAKAAGDGEPVYHGPRTGPDGQTYPPHYHPTVGGVKQSSHVWW